MRDKTATQRAVRFKNDAATPCGVIAALPKDGSADIVNSDAVSERSAKRVPPRAVLLRRQDGQCGSEYNAPWRAEHGTE